MKLHLTKTQTGLVPADPETEAEYKKLKLGQIIHGEFKRARNYKFLRKWFALLNVAFDNWEAPEMVDPHTRQHYPARKPEKNFERFRKDVTILAGYYHNVVRLDGTVRPTADSVSFGSMGLRL